MTSAESTARTCMITAASRRRRRRTTRCCTSSSALPLSPCCSESPATALRRRRKSMPLRLRLSPWDAVLALSLVRRLEAEPALSAAVAPHPSGRPVHRAASEQPFESEPFTELEPRCYFLKRDDFL